LSTRIVTLRAMSLQDDILGVSEIAALFGVARNTAWRWSREETFPAPAAELASGPIWKRVDIERWHRERQPSKGGRPPKQR
jgi:predicted DNA-binding transcriptional regulator AlpA